MSRQLESMYAVKKTDISRAGYVLADAFQSDPVWKKVLAGTTFNQQCAFFESPVRYGLMYGNVYAPSDNLEGIAAWVSEQHADMTLWRGIRSGSILSAMKVGMNTLTTMKPIFEPLETDRRTNMAGRAYLYLMIIGVATDYQRQGFGGTLLRAFIHESDDANMPLYLETSTERNVHMYEKYGFTVLHKMIHPIIHLPQWELVREPGVATIT